MCAVSRTAVVAWEDGAASAANRALFRGGARGAVLGLLRLDRLDLLRHAEGLDERGRGVERSATVVVGVLAVAEEDGIDAELHDGHEDGGDEVGKEADDDDDEERGRHLFVAVAERVRVQHAECDDAGAETDDQLAEEEHDVTDDVDGGDAHDVFDEERQAVPRRGAEGRTVDGSHDVRVAVQPLDALLQVPQAVFHVVAGVLDDFAILLQLLQSVHDEAHDDANELQNGDKEGTERGGTAVEVGHLLRRGDQREVLERVVVTALEIVLDKDAGNDEVAHGDDLERVLTFFGGIGVVGDRVGGTGGRLAHVRGDFIGADDTRLRKQVNSERDGERVDAEEHRVCEETREISKKEEEEDAQDDRTNATGDDDNLPTGGKVINVAFNRRERTREHLFDLVADALGERTQRVGAERIRVVTGGRKRVLRVLVTIAIVLARVERVRGLEENRVTRSLHRARVALLRRGQLAVVVVAVRFPISLGVPRAQRRADRIIAHPVHGVRDGSNRRGVLGLRTVLQANALGVSQIVLGADASRIIRVNPRREHNLPGIDEITRLVVFVIAVPAHLPAVIRAEEQNLRITRADAVKAEHEHRDPKHDEEEQKQNIRASSRLLQVHVQSTFIITVTAHDERTSGRAVEATTSPH